jgi:hypothetical protein
MVAVLSGVSVTREGAVLDFDSHDTRESWRNGNTAARGRTHPRGLRTAAQETLDRPDFAGVVASTAGRAPNDWPLINRHIGLKGGDRYRICFAHRTFIGNSSPQPYLGIVRVTNNAGEISGSRTQFLPLEAWSSTCTSWFDVPTDENILQFGITSAGPYLVDDIRIERFVTASTTTTTTLTSTTVPTSSTTLPPVDRTCAGLAGTPRVECLTTQARATMGCTAGARITSDIGRALTVSERLASSAGTTPGMRARQLRSAKMQLSRVLRRLDGYAGRPLAPECRTALSDLLAELRVAVGAL